MATWISPSEVYAVGKEVTLYPYEPVRPHGMPQYDRNCLPSDLRPGELRDFAKPDKKLEAKIRITEAIRIDQNRYSQIFACEVVAVPRKERPTWYQQSLSQTDKSMKQKPLTRKLVCKTIDAQFFPSSFGGPYSNSEEADGLLSRIHAAYAYYRWNKKTGYPHTMPQFYGGWAMKVAGGMDEEGRTVSRHVGLVLIEHIDGFSVEDLCIRDDDDQDWGTLAPRPGPVRFRTNGNEYKNITFDLKTRQLVMQQAIHGVVQGFQLGVEHHDFGPWNIFVTMRDGYQGLRELRVVILDHNDTQVWYETKYAKKSGRAYCLQKLPHPVHPAERCSAVALEKWRGFWPPTSDQCSGADADKQFAAWLRHKDVFGPKVEAKAPPYRGIPDENVEPKRSIKGLKKSVVKKPYAQKTYSTFDTLDLIGEREDAIDKPIIPTIMGELGVQDQPEEYVKGIEMAVRRAFLGGYQVKSVVNGSPYPGPDHEWWKAWRHDKPAPYGPTRRRIEKAQFRTSRLRDPNLRPFVNIPSGSNIPFRFTTYHRDFHRCSIADLLQLRHAEPEQVRLGSIDDLTGYNTLEEAFGTISPPRATSGAPIQRSDSSENRYDLRDYFDPLRIDDRRDLEAAFDPISPPRATSGAPIQRSDSSDQLVSGDYPPAQVQDISTSTNLGAPESDQNRQESINPSRGRGNNRQRSSTLARGRGNYRS